MMHTSHILSSMESVRVLPVNIINFLIIFWNTGVYLIGKVIPRCYMTLTLHLKTRLPTFSLVHQVHHRHPLSSCSYVRLSLTTAWVETFAFDAHLL